MGGRCTYLRVAIQLTIILYVSAQTVRDNFEWNAKSVKSLRVGSDPVSDERSWSVVGRQEQIIKDIYSQASDEFGASVASNGDVVVIGAPAARGETSRVPSGAAYIFRRKEDGKWAREAKLCVASSLNRDYFGSTVQIYEDIVAVGAYLAYGDLESVGLVYIWLYDLYKQEWVAEKVLGMRSAFNPNEEQKPGWGNNVMPSFDYFGRSVAIHNGTVLIGAYGHDTMGTFSGAAFIYDYSIISTRNGTAATRTTWSSPRSLLPSDLQSFSLFGWSLALAEGIAVVGAYGDAIKSRPYAGSVYVFERDAVGKWSQAAKIVAPDAMAHDHFGHDVAVKGGIVAISSQRSSGQRTIADGKVYLYRAVREYSRENRNNGGSRHFILFKELFVYTENSNHIFGYSLSMHKNLLLVGFSGDDTFRDRDAASAYLYSVVAGSDGSIDVVRDVSLVPFQGDGAGGIRSREASYAPFFGCSVAIHGNIIVVGASLADGTSAETGVVFSYTAGIDYFPIASSTYGFLVYFLPGAFIAIILVSTAFVFIGNYMTDRQRRYQELHEMPSDEESSIDASATPSESSSAALSASTRGLLGAAAE